MTFLFKDMNIEEEAEHDIEDVIESQSEEIASNKLQGKFNVLASRCIPHTAG